jgi:hypothetical protein
MTDAVHTALSLLYAIFNAVAAHGTGSIPPITC